MADLERSSRQNIRPAPAGRTRHAPCEDLPRHPHDHAFAALVLSGGYIEAGDTGRHRVEAGDVVLHQAWESHLDRFDRRGSEVLVLPIDNADVTLTVGRVADPDAIVQVAECDGGEAVRSLLRALRPTSIPPADWPDLLARALANDPDLNLAHWADRQGLHPGSLSRGFRQVFGLTPVAYRLVQNTRRALSALPSRAVPLSAIAHDSGFADQAHMTRAVRRLTGRTPNGLRSAS